MIKEDFNEYIGKSMSEIMDIENEKFKMEQENIDLQHNKLIDSNRTRMLTVQKLIDYLKTQNPNACIVVYEPNSQAYIEQLPDLPNGCLCTVKEDKETQLSFLNSWYKNTKNGEERVKETMEREYRYVNDDDIVIRF